MWDAALYLRFGGERARPFFDLLARVGAELPGYVVDMGCGPGDVLACLPEVDYVGIDINPKYIRAAQARYPGRGTFRCQAVRDAVVQEPAAYDVVMANAVLHHLDLGRAAAELRRVLAPGGVAVFCEPWGDNPLLAWARRRLS